MLRPGAGPVRPRRGSARRRREDQIVDAMMRLRRCHPRVFDALVVIIVHADPRTLDAVAELVDYALRSTQRIPCPGAANAPRSHG